MKLSVVIPTFKRSDDLDRCLGGLAGLDRKADQVIVVMRPEDTASAEVVARWTGKLPLEPQWIQIPGVVQALNLALDHVTGDILTITDDDSCALPDWLARIEAHFEADPKLGGLGGRDLNHEDGRILPADQAQVGLILPFGRIIGNHHSGYGPPREVQHIKGVNMSWRVAAMGGRKFSTRLRGAGAQAYFELAYSLDMIRHGWKLVYDPALQVHHYVAQRFTDDKRGHHSVKSLAEAAFNFYLALGWYMAPGPRRSAALAWAHYIGTAGHPGALRGLYFKLKGDQANLELREATAAAWDDAVAYVAKHRNSAKGDRDDR